MSTKSYTHKSFQVPGYIKRALDFLCPPENLTVSEWAEQRRILDEKSSAMPGPWSNDITPYLRGIMDEFNNYQTEEIVFCKCTQVGGTEVELNMLGYAVDQDPAPTMIVYPTDTLGESTVFNRILPMFNASPSLRERLDAKRSGKDEIQFDNMFIAISGANSPSGLASKPIRYLFMDEIDKYPPSSKKEADPISLAIERTKTFRNRKIYKTSTPTLRTGQIWKAMEACDCERHYFVPCPHCGEYIELKFSQLKWPERGEESLSNTDRAEQAYYVCQSCGAIINDSQKQDMLLKGEWRDVRCDTVFVRKVAFWINTLYSPFVRFSEVALEFMESKDDPEKLQNFTNSWLAEPWEETALKTSADMVLERQTEYERWVLPPWTKLVTGGVDVQEAGFYWTIRAFGDYMTSQNVAHGLALSFSEIEKIMNLELSAPDGTTKMLPRLVLIDSGDQTDMVYEFCVYNSDWALPVKGMGERVSHYTLTRINKTGSVADGMTLVLVDGGKYKDMIAARMKKPNGTGSWMVHAGCDLDYAEQVTAEHKIIKRDRGKEKRVWVPKKSHAANHYLDAEVYCFAAADLMGVRTLFLETERAKEEEKKQSVSSNKISSGFAAAGERWI